MSNDKVKYKVVWEYDRNISKIYALTVNETINILKGSFRKPRIIPKDAKFCGVE